MDSGTPLLGCLKGSGTGKEEKGSDWGKEGKGKRRGGSGGEGKRAGVGKGETKPWKPSKRAPPVRNPTQHISYVYIVGLELHQGWEGRKKKI